MATSTTQKNRAVEVTELAQTAVIAEATPTANHVVLGTRDTLNGTLSVEGSLEVHGTVEGGLVASGDIEVFKTATVNASIEGRNVTIQGTVTGNVTTKNKLFLNGSGSLTGNVRVAKLQIEDGATVNGSITMGSSWTTPSTTEE